MVARYPHGGLTLQSFVSKDPDDRETDDDDENPFSKKKLKNEDDPVTISKIKHATKENVDYKLNDGISPVYDTFSSPSDYDTKE